MFNFMKAYRRLLRETVKYHDKSFLPACLSLMFLRGLLPVMMALMPKLIASVLISVAPTEEKIKRVLLISGLYALIGLVAGFFGVYIQQRTRFRRAKTRMIYARDVQQHMYEVDFSFFESGELYRRYDGGISVVNAPSEGINGALDATVRLTANFFSLIFMLVLLATVNIPIALAILLYGLFYFLAEQKKNLCSSEYLTESNSLNHRKEYFKDTSGSFSFAKDIRLYRFQERLLSLYREQIKASQRILKKLRKAAYKAHTWPTIYLIICQAYFIYYLFTAFGRGDLQVDNLLMSIGLSYQLIMTIELAVGDFAFYIAYQMSFMADYYEFMENPELLPPSGDRLMPEGPLSIEFKNLYFRYPGCENYVLENLNMKIEAGETVALVGDNGAGKSSLIKLLVGLYRPNSGEILINGIKLDDFNIRERKKIFNPVFQSVLLWPVTLKENVAGTEQNIDIARVWDSLEKCGLKERVEAMPHGLDTLLDRAIDPEAIDLSGGESQKLAIARAVYKDGPVTILDEPTAALDALAEAEIYENLHSISVAKTSIYISHRLSSTKFCDRIFLLADRAVAEFGSHAELMALGGRYHEIFLTQGKYYQEEQEARNANA